MRRPNGAAGLLAILVVLASACDSPTESNDATAAISLSIVSGSGQTGAVGAELPQPLVVRVTKVVRGVTIGLPLQLVNFRVVSGGGSVFAGSALTDLQGMAREYWTLGPAVGNNVLEVRSVDPSSGQKQVFGRFEAIGVIPGPEVCNGFDDNLDGRVDDPTWRYCAGGVPAPNTNGMNACNAGYLDFNGSAADGCELLVTGRWTLAPVLSTDCPGFPIGPTHFTISEFNLRLVSSTEVRISAQISEISSGDLFEDVPFPLTPAGDFAANGPINLGGVAGGGGSFALSGRLTGPSTLEATVDVVLNLTFDFPIFGSRDGNCSEVHQTVIGTRAGS